MRIVLSLSLLNGKSITEYRDIGNRLDEIGASAAGSKIDSIRQPFIDRWVQIATNQPDLFRKAQHDYIQVTHYEPAVEKIKNEFGLDVNGSGSSGLQDAVWSTAVQHGPGTNVFRNALTSLGFPSTSISELSNKDVIGGIYDERSRVVVQADIDRKPRFRSDGTINNPKGYQTADIGKLIYFRNYLTTFPDRQKS